MAKAMKGKKAVTNGDEKVSRMVTVAMLADEYGVEGKNIRQALRAAGMKAPEIKEAEGFGPRAKYEWAEGSKELKEVKAILNKAFADKGKEEE